MEGLKMGTLEMAVAHDEARPSSRRLPFCIPFYDVMPMPGGSTILLRSEIADLMLQKTGIVCFAIADNGVRHFTNSLRPIVKPADMKGMKIRIMPSPVFKSLVESLGASPSAVPWGELPTALQSKVVDGQENGVTNILAASLYQYQKYITLDGHVWSIHAYVMNDKFFKGLTPEQQKVILEATKIARDIHRKMTSDQDQRQGDPDKIGHAGH
jgi:C4-dicarboxylate-binding protein DctP